MKFIYEDRLVQLQGIPKPQSTESSLHQLRRMVNTHAIDSVFQLHILDSPEAPTDTTTPPELDQILTNFLTIFEPPTHLPPNRPTDHKIPLLSNSDPVNVQPYRYPQFQKREIEE